MFLFSTLTARFATPVARPEKYSPGEYPRLVSCRRLGKTVFTVAVVPCYEKKTLLDWAYPDDPIGCDKRFFTDRPTDDFPPGHAPTFRSILMFDIDTLLHDANLTRFIFDQYILMLYVLHFTVYGFDVIWQALQLPFKAVWHIIPPTHLKIIRLKKK